MSVVVLLPLLLAAEEPAAAAADTVEGPFTACCNCAIFGLTSTELEDVAELELCAAAPLLALLAAAAAAAAFLALAT